MKIAIDYKILILKPQKACFDEIENFACVCVCVYLSGEFRTIEFFTKLAWVARAQHGTAPNTGIII